MSAQLKVNDRHVVAIDFGVAGRVGAQDGYILLIPQDAFCDRPAFSTFEYRVGAHDLVGLLVIRADQLLQT